MQKKKLSLDKIEVQSFITLLDIEERKTLGGGADSNGFFCSWYLSGCVFSLACPTFGADPACKTRVKVVQLCNDMSTKKEVSNALEEFCPLMD